MMIGLGGDRDDRFEEIFRKYFRRVYSYFRSNRVADDEAQDLAQDTFKRFYEHMDQIRGDEPWPFLQKVARTILLNRIRALNTIKRSVNLVDIDDPDFPHDPPNPHTPDYAEQEEAELRRKRLYAAIEELSPGQRECLTLWLSGMEYEPIAKTLKISLDAVRSRLRDARRQLRARLGADELPEDEE